MQSDDMPINGQHNPNFLDLLNQTPPPPDAKDWPRPKRFARLRQAWDTSWEEGGFLYQRWDEVARARHAGWHQIAPWLKAAVLLAGASLIVIMVDTAGDVASAALKGLSAVPATNTDTGDGSGLWGTVDHPVRVFLADQAAHLAVTPAALYAVWQLTGVFSLVGGFLGNTGARLIWLLFGIASLAMVWSASPAGGRAAATGLAALLWALAGIVALRGLTLRRVAIGRPATVTARPEIHVLMQPPAPATEQPPHSSCPFRD
ncbi:hypothetical protein ACFY8B_30485 [Streptomyces sp. NPDC012751]|uniref:hypothetical protein n=1 Tax=Streptomyces sp. NPDC012751 TaxID=3364846 RepID=UPI0036AFFD42